MGERGVTFHFRPAGLVIGRDIDNAVELPDPRCDRVLTVRAGHAPDVNIDQDNIVGINLHFFCLLPAVLAGLAGTSCKNEENQELRNVNVFILDGI